MIFQMKFGEMFENEFLNQDSNEHRDINQTLDIALEILKLLD